MPDGKPSGTLERRTLSALDIAKFSDDAIFIPSGARGRYGPPEAEVMRNILVDHGVRPDKIVLDADSRDTMDTIINCGNLIRERYSAGDTVITCSSTYHNFRCRALFRMLGVPAIIHPVRSDIGKISARKLGFFWIREIPATLWDVVLMMTGLLSGKITPVRLPQ